MAAVIIGLAMLGQVSTSEVEQVAAEAGVDVVDLQGAVNTTGREPREYLIAVGELPAQAEPGHGSQPPAPPLNAAIERRLDCIEHYESRGYPLARNRTSGASGLFQFLPSTWASTPQGKAGLSVFDPIAARDGARWMLQVGRAREWVPVQLGLC